MSADRATAQRLEMLLVLQWLDEGMAVDGDVMLSVPTAAADLGFDGNEGLLALMTALGVLEEEGRVRVEWPGRPFDSAEARVLLSPEITRDAQRLFGA
ncbi:MAG: hypothetical protein FJW99_05510 [Actinobacteria bacterium]|nr:hypothetical protein [Actinomycetota bacterium]MBM3696902.1 hypothetical protein [Actinomycetota bacterium]